MRGPARTVKGRFWGRYWGAGGVIGKLWGITSEGKTASPSEGTFRISPERVIPGWPSRPGVGSSCFEKNQAKVQQIVCGSSGATN